MVAYERTHAADCENPNDQVNPRITRFFDGLIIANSNPSDNCVTDALKRLDQQYSDGSTADSQYRSKVQANPDRASMLSQFTIESGLNKQTVEAPYENNSPDLSVLPGYNLVN